MDNAPVKAQYEHGDCPDCGRTIPDAAAYESACEHCGHVFNVPDVAQ